LIFRSAIFLLAAASVLPAADIPPGRLRMFKPLPAAMDSADNPSTPAKIDLGRMLYYENRLSKSHKFSCNSCHQLDKYGVDNQPTSEGHNGQRGDRNSPTVYNAAAHFVQFWDGRAATVEDQAKGPVLNPVEMAMPDEKSVVVTLKSMPEYVALFKKAFPGEAEPVTLNNVAKAIGAFERKLVTPSRWDRFLAGDKSALTEAEKAGFLKYYEAGCGACHVGSLVGASTYQKAGVAKPWPNQKDPGRFAVTKKNEDKMIFKVPSLRNIEKTWPYMHDGKVATLEEAVRIMGDYNASVKLTDADVQSIITFLKSLTGTLPLDYIKPPKLPASTAKTPKPVVSD
jgi:cytochrome c peroxidase